MEPLNNNSVNSGAAAHSSPIRYFKFPLLMFKSLPRGVFAVSLFGLFLGASTTMVYSQLSLFMQYELHASALKIAFIDGLVEFVSYLVRIFSGAVSDYFMNRKAILFVGCGLTLFMKPLFAIAQSSLMILIAQSVERIGNGLQAVPRDALIADLSTNKERGQSFGFSKSLKTLGGLMGTCVAIAIMYFTNDNYRTVFLCSTIAVAIAIFCLTKIKTKPLCRNEGIYERKVDNPFSRKYLKSMDTTFWKIVALAVVFELGHFSETLFPLYADMFISKTLAGSVSMFISIGQVICSLPIGFLADKLGKGKFIRVCFVMMILANLLFLSAKLMNSIMPVFIGAFLWGGQMSAVQGLFLAIVTEKVDPRLRGTAIGVYYLSIGIAYFIASNVAGYLWNVHGSSYAFLYSITWSTISLAVFKTLFPKKTVLVEHGSNAH